jgi:hypothetical protein
MLSPSLSSAKFQAEMGGEPIRHVQAERLLAGDEPHDTCPRQAGFSFQRQVIRLPTFHGGPNGSQ